MLGKPLRFATTAAALPVHHIYLYKTRASPIEKSCAAAGKVPFTLEPDYLDSSPRLDPGLIIAGGVLRGR